MTFARRQKRAYVKTWIIQNEITLSIMNKKLVSKTGTSYVKEHEAMLNSKLLYLVDVCSMLVYYGSLMLLIRLPSFKFKCYLQFHGFE